MKNKKIFLFAFLSFLIVGCDSVGGVNLTDTRGNKYTFKNDSVNCRSTSDAYPQTLCEGSAIKKDIAGNRYVTEFAERQCKYTNYSNVVFESIGDSLICNAAKELGKL